MNSTEGTQRVIRGTKGTVGLRGQLPQKPRTDSVLIDTSIFTAQLEWAAPLTKTADPTRNFNAVRFTGMQMAMTDGIAGIAQPFAYPIMAGVAVPSTPLFQLAKTLKTIGGQTSLSVLEKQLVIQAEGLTVQIPRVDASILPPWPIRPMTEVSVQEKQWSAIFNVIFGVSKNPNSLISLQALALRKNVAIAADESRIVLQPTGFGDSINTLLMDRFLMLLERGHADPVKLSVGEDRIWAVYEDGTEVWGAVPAIPWPESTDEIIKTHFNALKGKKPDLTWEGEDLAKGLQKLQGFGDGVTLTATAGQDTVSLATLSPSGGAISTVKVPAPDSNFAFTTRGATLQESVSVTNKLWYLKEGHIVVLRGQDGLFIIMGTML